MLMVFYSLFVLIFMVLFSSVSWFLNLTWIIFILFFIFKYPLIYSNINNINSFLFYDTFSMSLLYLSIWITLLCLISSNKTLSVKNSNLYMFTLDLIMFVVMLTFLVSKFMFFYFFFEFSIIPTLYLIIGWGVKIERMQSGLFMFFYTIFSSLPLMLSIMFLLKFNYTLSFNNLLVVNISKMLTVFLLLAFLVKIPMFLFHSWLPKAHVEAPVSGSMILAGILLKLGGYGLLRTLMIIPKLSLPILNSICCLSILGGVYSSMICLRQSDLKVLIAYSSVSHMGLLISGMLTFSTWGLTGSVMLMVCHGFCSSALFFLVNLNYEQIYSRSMVLNKGFMNLMPTVSMWWFLFCSCNMSAPPSLNLLSEILLSTVLISWNSMNMVILILICFLTGVYNLYMFCNTQHGVYVNGLKLIKQSSMMNLLSLKIHIIPLLLAILKLEMFF